MKYDLKTYGMLAAFVSLGFILNMNDKHGGFGLAVAILIVSLVAYAFYRWAKMPKGSAWVEEQRKTAKERKEVASTERTIKVGSETIRKRMDDTYYFGTIPIANPAKLYTFEGIDHTGSTFSTVSRTAGKTKQQGRAGSALAGGLLFGPVGAVVGASRKRKGRINTKTTHEERESKGLIDVAFRNVDTHEVHYISARVTNNEAANIERFFY